METSTILPFSTPGPSSGMIFERPRDPTKHVSLLEHCRPDDCYIGDDHPEAWGHSTAPYSRPGPLQGSSHTPLSVQVSQYPTRPTSSRDHPELPLPTWSNLEPILPFSTPGPTMAMRCDSLLHHQALALSRSASSMEVMIPLLTSPSPLRSPLSLPQDTSVSQDYFKTDHQDPEAEFVCTPSLDGEPNGWAVSGIDYESIGFRWQRFDRGNIILDASSSSPVPAETNSEEQFWGQSTEHASDRLQFPTYSPMQANPVNSSPASLRLTGVATPPIHSPSPRRSPRSYSRALKVPGADSPFAWIVPPRDKPAPSKPRMGSSPHHASLDQTRLPHVRHPAPIRHDTDGSHVGPHRYPSAKLDDVLPVMGVPDAPLNPSRLPFAPAPGIYISPLKDQPDVGVETRGHDGNATEATTITRNAKADASLQAEDTQAGTASTSGRRCRTAAPSLQLPQMAKERNSEHECSQEDISTCQSQSSGRSMDEAPQNTAMEEDEIQEDDTTCHSQESRDTIESWTD
ncbi:hypothetical protein C8Q76DRAFT_704555 [Earliella scabrosa]|nr:hypothetical protein C8Q76DRAFT_704555 [Earliella scabrosa]